MKRQWVKEWPTKAGVYWFHGQRWKDSEREAETVLVRVNTNGKSIFYVSEGHFMYPSETGDGVWTEAQIPTPE